jgi:hypothetical protein
MWWWHKKIPADITPDVRNELELFGETVIAFAMADADIQMREGPLATLLRSHYAAARSWLQEQRSIHQRREDRLETVEVAILIFVFLGVIVELISLWKALH